MENDDAFLHNFFSYTSQGCYDKAKECVVSIILFNITFSYYNTKLGKREASSQTRWTMAIIIDTITTNCLG